LRLCGSNLSPENIVASYGIPTAPMKLAAGADEAAKSRAN